MPISPELAFTAELLLIVIVSVVTGRKNTYTNIATNGVICVMAGGTLLYDQKIVGLFLLVYGVFLMTFGVKEYEEEKTGFTGIAGKLVRVFGHYSMVTFVLLLFFAVEYLGIDVLAYAAIIISVIAGLIIV